MQQIDINELIAYHPASEKSAWVQELQKNRIADVEVTDVLDACASNALDARAALFFMLDHGAFTIMQHWNIVRFLDTLAVPTIGVSLSVGKGSENGNIPEWLETINTERRELLAARPVVPDNLVQMYLRDYVIHFIYAQRSEDFQEVSLLSRRLHEDAAACLKMACYHFLKDNAEMEKNFFEALKQIVIDNPPEESDDYIVA